MNGAESLIRTLLANDIDVCFANPGTSEMHLVAALDRISAMRPILCLFEGVVTGAADGYARMARKPACTLLHLGPGLGNGIANLHNAKKAHSPVVNIVGDHATYHLKLDAPLASDIALLASHVSGFVRTASAQTLSVDAADTIAASLSSAGQVATLIVPANVAWGDGPDPASRVTPPPRPTVISSAVARCTEALRSGKPAALLMSGEALTDEGLEIAGRIAAKTGCRLICDTFNSRISRGGGRVKVERLPYFAEQAIDTLTGLATLITVGTKSPVAFFAYPDKPSSLLPEGTIHLSLSAPHEDTLGALATLSDELCANVPLPADLVTRHQLPSGRLDAMSVGQALAALMPEDAIISDEGGTLGGPSWGLTANSPAHDWLFLTGGSIGQGLPVATGAAIACPDRKVICIHGDGGAMYTLQALWTQSRERLDVVTIVLSNRKYAVLQVEFSRVGAGKPGPRALDMLSLSNPELNWVDLARGMGVEASRAQTADEFVDQLRSAIAGRGPRLIEAIIV